jgi:hypothetical protein
MATTDQDQFTEIQFQVLEPTQDGGVTWLSGLWTAQEVLDYANQRQYRFMKDTLLMMAYARVDHTANQNLGALPPDWMVTYRADWLDKSGTGTNGQIHEMARTSQWEFDHSRPNWANTPAVRPIGFSDTENQTLQYQLMPPPIAAGQVLLLYVSLTAVLTGAGEIFTVPDEFVPAIKYGILADMLRKVGRGQDMERADYCEMRYAEGVEAAKLMLAGWTDQEQG